MTEDLDILSKDFREHDLTFKVARDGSYVINMDNDDLITIERDDAIEIIDHLKQHFKL